MSKERQIVGIVIPIYRAQLSASERLSFERCMAVLGSHPIVIAKPEHLDVSLLRDRHPQLMVESFRKEFFNGVEGYNRMMLSDEFYARFAHYEFILIHQLDAFVFKDELLAWCARDYDYIGAPWLRKGLQPHRWRLFAASIRRTLYRMINKQHRGRGFGSFTQLYYSAGNGGFSLRRVDKIREVLASLDSKAKPYRLNTRFPWAEDVFFSVEVNRFKQHLKTPDTKVAAQFAWESEPALASTLTGGDLPFGCHGWNKLHLEEWRPVFRRFGYDLDEILAADAGIATPAAQRL